MITSKTRKIQALVEDVKGGQILLPELQRRYVWKSPQVRDLFDSLYHGYPSGQLLIWETDDIPYSRTLSVKEIDKGQRTPQLLLDGQQRLTSLTAILLGQDLILRDSHRPIDIAFNIFSERFEVSGPRQNRETGWISLKHLYTQGAMSVLMELNLDEHEIETKRKIFDRINRLDNIRNYEYHINVLEKLSYDEVTHIFVRVNSGGTKLNSADLALAQMSTLWRGITNELTDFQSKITKVYPKLFLDTGIIIRSIAVILSGNSKLDQLFKGETRYLTEKDLQDAWKRVIIGMKQAVEFLAQNCLIDRFELLPTQYVLITLITYFDYFEGKITDKQSRDLQRWLYLALIWSRYSTSSETAINQDVVAIRGETPIDTMIQNIYDKSGHRPVTERELRDQRKNSPFMLMSYVIARRRKAKDWFNGVHIGANQDLHLHHIFPKAILREKYDLRRDSRVVDQVANLAFLSNRANNTIGRTPPEHYLPDIEPNRLIAQLLPEDNALWILERFEDFLLERRTLIADTINQLLSSLTEEPQLWVSDDEASIESRIDALENNLRDIIAGKLLEARGDDAYTLIPASIRNTLNRNESKVLSQNPFEAGKFDILRNKLTLALYSDLGKIIQENWALFEDIFGVSDRFNLEIGRAIAIRNAIKHNRGLNRSEKASVEAALIWLEDCTRVAVFEEMVTNVD